MPVLMAPSPEYSPFDPMLENRAATWVGEISKHCVFHHSLATLQKCLSDPQPLAGSCQLAGRTPQKKSWASDDPGANTYEMISLAAGLRG